MIEKQLKRAIWAMNEILQASPRGISREELGRKWYYSAMNDSKEPGIPERTFYRIRNLLQSVFDVEIECVNSGAERLYRVSSDCLGPGCDSLMSLMLSKKESEKKARPSYMLDILSLIMAGKEIPQDDMSAIKAIAYKLNRVPYESGKQLIDSTKAGELNGADSAEWDENYRGYVCVWNDADYLRTDLWLSIGIYDDHVLFYVVTSVQDSEYRDKVSEMLRVDNGGMYKSGYWWYEPSDKSLFRLDFRTFPDMAEVKRRAGILISRLAALANEIHKPEE